jgi:hypothetical protein
MFSELGMREAIIELHGNLPATSTFARNQQEVPIDGIFVTPTICLQGGGYFPFGEGPGNDHRALWLDLSYQTAFGHAPPPMGVSQARRLTCKDPRVRDRYLALYRPFVRQHQLDLRSYELQASVNGPLTTTQATEYEAVSTLRGQGMAYATAHCRKFRMGEVDWNPDLQVLRNLILAWKLKISQLSGCRVSSRYLIRCIQDAYLPSGVFETSLLAAKLASKVTFKAYKAAKKEHIVSRESWLSQLAQSKSQDDGKSADNHAKSLITIEKQRRQARNVKRMNQKMKSFGTSKIIAPNSSGSWVEFTSKEDIEAGCQQENSQRFSQTESTPFMTSPLIDIFGYLAQGPAADSVLDGSFVPPPGTDPYAVKLLAELKMAAAVREAPPMRVVFSVDEHIKGWRKAREFTASGPSGLTFSHFIAGTYDQTIASFDATMANIPYATGYSSLRWQSGTDVMIPKSVASLWVDKLRTLLLLDPEYNQNNKLLGRSVMAHAEKYGQIPAEQYGSRKKHRAIEAALNKVLTQDIWRQK